MTSSVTAPAPPLRVGVVGLGWMGQVHARAYTRVGQHYLDAPLRPVLVAVADNAGDARIARTVAAYGFADMGPYGGGQAELLRVPWGDFNCLRLGEDAEERQSDYVMLADIFPTGYHATEMAGVQPGDQTVIYGAGPVGLMAALSATIRGAGKVMVVDRHPDRLRLAESIGAIAIDDSKVDPVQVVLDETMGLGADNGCECVGYQAHEPDGEEQPNLTLNRLVGSVRFTGRIGAVGVFVPQDPGGRDELAKQGQIAFDYGMFWFKGQHLGSGQAPVKKYNRQLRDLIAAGRAEPSFISASRYIAWCARWKPPTPKCTMPVRTWLRS